MLQQKQMVQSRVMNNGFKLYPSNKKQFQALDGFQPEPSPRGGDMVSASGKGSQDISRGVAKAKESYKPKVSPIPASSTNHATRNARRSLDTNGIEARRTEDMIE